jgi:hypothetical protein
MGVNDTPPLLQHNWFCRTNITEYTFTHVLRVNLIKFTLAITITIIVKISRPLPFSNDCTNQTYLVTVLTIITQIYHVKTSIKSFILWYWIQRFLPYTLYLKISYSCPVYYYWKMLSRYAPRFIITKHICFENNIYSILIMLFTVTVYLACYSYICHLIWHSSIRQIEGHTFVVNIKCRWLHILSDIHIQQGTHLVLVLKKVDVYCFQLASVIKAAWNQQAN